MPAQTLWRWRRWWRERFVQTRCWQALAGQFVPPLAAERLPASLLERLTGKTLDERVVQLLVLLCPATISSGSLRGELDPQKR